MLTIRPKTGAKANDLDEDYTVKAKAKTKANIHKAKDLENVLKDSSRSRPRANITDMEL